MENMEYFENLKNLILNLFSYGGVEWSCLTFKVSLPNIQFFCNVFTVSIFNF